MSRALITEEKKMSVPYLGPIATGTAVALTGSIISSDNSFSKQLPIALAAGALTAVGCAFAARTLRQDGWVMRTANWLTPAVVAYSAAVGTTGAIMRRGEMAGYGRCEEAPEIAVGLLAAGAVIGAKGAMARMRHPDTSPL
jgi:hypothetical protein